MTEPRVSLRGALQRVARTRFGANGSPAAAPTMTVPAGGVARRVPTLVTKGPFGSWGFTERGVFCVDSSRPSVLVLRESEPAAGWSR